MLLDAFWMFLSLTVMSLIVAILSVSRWQTQPIRDRETNTTWNLKGEAVAGSLQGKRLQQLPSHNAFWFAWATFWQNTGIY